MTHRDTSFVGKDEASESFKLFDDYRFRDDASGEERRQPLRSGGGGNRTRRQTQQTPRKNEILQADAFQDARRRCPIQSSGIGGDAVAEDHHRV